MNNGKKYNLKYFLLDKRKVSKMVEDGYIYSNQSKVMFYNPYVEISHN